MVNMNGVVNFEAFGKKHFSRGGNTKALGVSRAYLELLFDGVLPPSIPLLLKARNQYDVGYINFLSRFDLSSNNYQPLLVSAEALSHNAEFVKGLNASSDKFKEDLSENGSLSNDSMRDLANIVGEFYPSIHVAGRMSTILTNISNYFIMISLNSELKRSVEYEFNYAPRLKNPFVAVHKKNNSGIRPEEFMNVTELENSVLNYEVNGDFLPWSVKSVWTDSNNWRMRFLDVPRTYKTKDDFNKVFIKYAKPLSQELLDALRNEAYYSFKNPSFNPDFYLLSKGTRALFDDKFLLSEQTKNDVLLVQKSRPVFSLETDKGDNVLGVYFYPVQILSHSMKAGGGDHYWPSPSTLKMINRFQNRVDGRVKK